MCGGVGYGILDCAEIGEGLRLRPVRHFFFCTVGLSGSTDRGRFSGRLSRWAEVSKCALAIATNGLFYKISISILSAIPSPLRRLKSILLNKIHRDPWKDTTNDFRS